MNGERQAQFNMLNDITKIAAIKATSALSKMLKFPIGVDVVPVEAKRLDQIKFLMEGNEKIVGLSVPILGLLPGTCLLIYPENSALAICDRLLGRNDGKTTDFGDIEVSALNEVANIVIGNFLTSFAMPLQIDSMMHRSAHFSYNHLSEFMDDISVTLSKSVSDGIVVEIAFHFEHVKIQGAAVFLFNEANILDQIQKVNA